MTKKEIINGTLYITTITQTVNTLIEKKGQKDILMKSQIKDIYTACKKRYSNLLEKILLKNSHIKEAILFDLPMIIENAQTSIKNDKIKSKIKFIMGNFLNKIPIKVDTIVISRVLHDWNDSKVLEILKNINLSLKENGTLLLFEIIVPEDSNYNVGITLNFNLLVCTGGKERTLKELQGLLNKANFEISQIKQRKSNISLIIVKKGT